MSQHIPATFSTSYAKRLNRESIISVREVLSSTRLESGFAYLAPGSHHIIIKKKDGHFWAMLDEGEKVNRHRPSVDVMFNSIVDLRVKDCLGIVLTGMGKDGAKGLKALKDIGATTFVQDGETSVVWGMPGSSVKEGGVDCILPLGEIAQAIVNGK
jgi:two-component system chemotaxis response regulator CheB